jgi:hypothetical protein
VEALGRVGIKKVRLRPDYTVLNGSWNGSAADPAYYGSHRMMLPPDCITVLLPYSFTVGSWGSYLPGVKSVATPPETYLPPGHFLVEKYAPTLTLT